LVKKTQTPVHFVCTEERASSAKHYPQKRKKQLYPSHPKIPTNRKKTAPEKSAMRKAFLNRKVGILSSSISAE